ncbi:anaphase promoting complex subunit 5, partial [Quaeritorhiza haematococci]
VQEKLQLDKTSPFGVYVRRALIEFNRMMFDEVGRFFSILRVYRDGDRDMSNYFDDDSGKGYGAVEKDNHGASSLASSSLSSPFAGTSKLRMASGSDCTDYIRQRRVRRQITVMQRHQQRGENEREPHGEGMERQQTLEQENLNILSSRQRTQQTVQAPSVSADVSSSSSVVAETRVPRSGMLAGYERIAGGTPMATMSSSSGVAPQGEVGTTDGLVGRSAKKPKYDVSMMDEATLSSSTEQSSAMAMGILSPPLHPVGGSGTMGGASTVSGGAGGVPGIVSGDIGALSRSSSVMMTSDSALESATSNMRMSPYPPSPYRHPQPTSQHQSLHQQTSAASRTAPALTGSTPIARSVSFSRPSHGASGSPPVPRTRTSSRGSRTPTSTSPDRVTRVFLDRDLGGGSPKIYVVSSASPARRQMSGSSRYGAQDQQQAGVSASGSGSRNESIVADVSMRDVSPEARSTRQDASVPFSPLLGAALRGVRAQDGVPAPEQAPQGVRTGGQAHVHFTGVGGDDIDHPDFDEGESGYGVQDMSISMEVVDDSLQSGVDHLSGTSFVHTTSEHDVLRSEGSPSGGDHSHTERSAHTAATEGGSADDTSGTARPPRTDPSSAPSAHGMLLSSSAAGAPPAVASSSSANKNTTTSNSATGATTTADDVSDLDPTSAAQVSPTSSTSSSVNADVAAGEVSYHRSEGDDDERSESFHSGEEEKEEDDEDEEEEEYDHDEAWMRIYGRFETEEERLEELHRREVALEEYARNYHSNMYFGSRSESVSMDRRSEDEDEDEEEEMEGEVESRGGFRSDEEGEELREGSEVGGGDGEEVVEEEGTEELEVVEGEGGEEYIAEVARECRGLIENARRRYRRRNEGTISLYDADRFLDNMVEMMEKSSGLLLPQQIQSQLDHIYRHMPDLAKVHYVRAGEFEGALDSLHRFFDYCLYRERRVVYQYALLNLAVLHTRFNHIEEASMAINEAIQVARDNHDQECLSYSLSGGGGGGGGAYTLTSNHLSEKQMLDSLVGRTKELDLVYLQSLGELNRAKQGLQTGENPVRIFESLQRSSVLNTHFALEGVQGSNYLLAASVWDTYGNMAMSSLYAQLQITHHGKETTQDDMALGYCMLAHQHAANGDYEQALKLLLDAQRKFPLFTSGAAAQWVRCLGIVLFQRALYRNDFKTAEVVASQLGAISLAGQASHSHARLEAESLKAELYCQRGQLKEAFEQICDIIDEACRPDTQYPLQSVMGLLKLAEIHMDAGTPVTALPLILTCLTIAERFHLDRTRNSAHLLLAQVLLHFHLPFAALEMARGILPAVLSDSSGGGGVAGGVGDLYAQGRAYLLHAECVLGCVSAGGVDGGGDLK